MIRSNDATCSDSQAKTRISVVIATFGRPSALRRCLTALADQDLDEAEFEVIVVDDGSDPPVRDVAASFSDEVNIRYFRQSNSGPSAARNLGVSVAAGEFIAFTDDDCRPSKDWLSTILQALEDHPNSVVGGMVLNGLPHNLYSTVSQSIVDLVYISNSDSREAFVFGANNLAMTKSAFETARGFDVAFKAAEDRDLCDRLAILGHTMIPVHKAIVVHEHGMGFRKYVAMYVRYGRGAFRFHQLRRSRRPGSLCSTIKFHLRLASFLSFIRERNPQIAGWKILSLLAVWQGATIAGMVLEGGRYLRRRLVGQLA